MAYCIGEGVMPAPLGYSMYLFGYKSLMVVVLITCLGSWWSFEQGVSILENDKKSDEPIARLLAQ